MFVLLFFVCILKLQNFWFAEDGNRTHVAIFIDDKSPSYITST